MAYDDGHVEQPPATFPARDLDDPAWGKAVHGLRSRIVLERRSFKRLGQGVLGHVYLRKESGDPDTHWTHAARDIGAALGVGPSRP